jgi:hypothetical protein
MANKKPAMGGDATGVEQITAQYPEPREAQNLDSVKGMRNVSGAPSASTTLMPRKNTQAADPAFMPIGNRVYAPKERGGAAYGLRLGITAPIINPEAGATQANGRIMKSAIQRTAPNFGMGMMG